MLLLHVQDVTMQGKRGPKTRDSAKNVRNSEHGKKKNSPQRINTLEGVGRELRENEVPTAIAPPAVNLSRKQKLPVYWAS
jgi:hypothetical protein